MVDYRSLLGQHWSYGNQDCYTIVRQYFALQGVDLPDFARPDDLDTASSVYLREALALGFEPVAFEDRRIGDIAIMRLGTAEPMHAAVFVEPWRILHHCRDRPSGVDWLNSYYVNSIAAVFRYAAGSSAG